MAVLQCTHIIIYYYKRRHARAPARQNDELHTHTQKVHSYGHGTTNMRHSTFCVRISIPVTRVLFNVYKKLPNSFYSQKKEKNEYLTCRLNVRGHNAMENVRVRVFCTLRYITVTMTFRSSLLFYNTAIHCLRRDRPKKGGKKNSENRPTK